MPTIIDNNFVVYEHYTANGELFYVGEGRLHRAYSSQHRNKAWNRLAANGYSVNVLGEGFTKREAEDIETTLILIYRASGILLINVCIGPLYSGGMAGVTGPAHPSFGKPGAMRGKFGPLNPMFGKPGLRGIENPMYGRTGKSHPTYGVPRQRLVGQLNGMFGKPPPRPFPRGLANPMAGKTNSTCFQPGEAHPLYGVTGAAHPAYGRPGPMLGRTGASHPAYGRTGARHVNSKKVICVDTGKTWECARALAEHLKMDVSNLRRACREGTLVKGLKYTYINTEVKNAKNHKQLRT